MASYFSRRFITTNVDNLFFYNVKGIRFYVSVSIDGTFVRDRNDVLCRIKMWLRAESSLITTLQRLCFGEKALSSHLYSVSSNLGTKIEYTRVRELQSYDMLEYSLFKYSGVR